MNKQRILHFIEKALIIVGALVVILGFVLSPMLDEGAGYQGFLTLSVIASVIGGFWILIILGLGTAAYLSKKCSNVGLWLTLATHATVLTVCLASFNNESTSLSCIIALIGTIIYFVGLIFKGINCLLIKSSSPDDDPLIQSIIKWKELQERGIITQEEFEEKRCSILNIKKETKK